MKSYIRRLPRSKLVKTSLSNRLKFKNKLFEFTFDEMSHISLAFVSRRAGALKGCLGYLLSTVNGKVLISEWVHLEKILWLAIAAANF